MRTHEPNGLTWFGRCQQVINYLHDTVVEISIRVAKSLVGFLEQRIEATIRFRENFEVTTGDEVDEQIGGERRRWKGGLFTPSDGRAEPGKAVPAVARAVERMGGAVLTECAVRTVEQAAGKDPGGGCGTAEAHSGAGEGWDNPLGRLLTSALAAVEPGEDLRRE